MMRFERGNALFPSLVLTTAMAGVVLACLGSTGSALRTSREQRTLVQGVYWAQRAAAFAKYDLDQGGSGNLAGDARTGLRAAGDAPTPTLESGVVMGDAADLYRALRSEPNGAFRTRVHELASGEVLLESVAVCDGNTRGIAQVLEPVPSSSLPPAGLIATNGIYTDADGKVVADSYDSALSPYATQAINAQDGYSYANDKGFLASNGVIDIADGIIFGDALRGPDGTLTTTATVTGSTAPLPGWDAPPSVVWAPPTLNDNGLIGDYLNGGNQDFKVDTFQSVTLAAGSYEVGTFDQKDFSRLSIPGGTVSLYVRDNFTQDPNSWIILGTGARLNIVVDDGSVDLRGSVVNPNRPENLTLRAVQSNRIELRLTDPEFTGLIYAPDTLVKLTRDAEIFGSVVGDTIHTTGTHTLIIHRDETLNPLVGVGAAGTDYRIVQEWSLDPR